MPRRLKMKCPIDEGKKMMDMGRRRPHKADDRMEDKKRTRGHERTTHDGHIKDNCKGKRYVKISKNSISICGVNLFIFVQKLFKL